MKVACIAPFVVLLAIFVSGCITTRGGKNGASGPSGIDPEGLNEAAMQRSLWSPAYRRLNAQHHFLVGESLYLNGETDKAHAYIGSAYRLDPNPFLGAKLIALEAGMGDLGKALPNARSMILLYPKSARLHLIYGQILIRLGRGKDGVKAIERAIELDPRVESAYLELMSFHQSKTDYGAAISVAKDYAKEMPSSFQAWSSLARLYLTAGQHKKALSPAKKAYDMQSNNPEITLIYALAMELSGNSQSAVALYEQLYRLNPANEDLIGRMVALYREIGDLKIALGLLDELDRISGGDKPAIQMQRAFILWELERFPEAATILDRLSKKYPDSERLKYMSALGQEKLGQYQEALRRYESVPEESSLRIQADTRRVLIFRELKQHKRAAKLVDGLLEDPEIDWNVFALAGTVHAEVKDFDSAVTAVEKGYKRHPTKHRLLFLKGVYQEKLGDVDACIQTMRDVIAKDSKNSAAYNYLGYLFADLNRNNDEVAEAETLLRDHALAIKPNDPFYLDSLGWVYFRQNKLKKALEIIEKAHKLLPKEGLF